jgi:drug/metabolite transporter (DMT)-like permease
MNTAKFMILASVTLSAFAQLALKHGLTRAQSRRSQPGVVALFFSIVTESAIWIWGFCFVLAMALWMVGLQSLDLSFAYPMVSLGYVVVTVLSAFLFNERVDAQRWLAVVIICLGVSLIARS